MSSIPVSRPTFLLFMAPLACGFGVYAVLTLEMAGTGVLIKKAAWHPELRGKNVCEVHYTQIDYAKCTQKQGRTAQGQSREKRAEKCRR
jgi:hypothetical protein